MRWILRSKIHNATLTEANPAYIGSITIDHELMERAGMRAGEKVLVLSNERGERLETYVIAGESGSGAIAMNGTALCMKSGEQVIIMDFELADSTLAAAIVLVDETNRYVRIL